MKYKLCRDRYTDGIAAPLPATFGRQKSTNWSAEEAEMTKLNTAYHIVKEELLFT